MEFRRVYVWSGSVGTDTNDFHNWTPVFTDQQAPGPDDLTIFNSGNAITVDGKNNVFAEIDVVLGTTLTLLNGMEGNGSVHGVALVVDSAGTVIVGSGAAVTDAGAVDVIGFNGTGTLRIVAGGSLDDTGMVLGDHASGSGTMTVDGAGSLAIVANVLPGQPNGVLIVGNGGSGAVEVRNSGSLGSVFAVLGEQVGASGVATVDGATWTAAFLTIGHAGAGSVVVQNSGSLISATITISASGRLDVLGSLGGPGSVTTVGLTMAGGTLDVTRGGIAVVGTASGTASFIQVDDTYTLAGIGTLAGDLALHGTGMVRATGSVPGTLVVTGNVIGSGTIEPLMTLDLKGAAANGVAIAFSAPNLLEQGVLVLDDPTAEGGTISGFAEGNTIDLPGLHFTTALFTQGTLGSPGTLVVSGGTETPLSFPMVGGYAPGDFIATSDTLGTVVTLVPCFVAGTLIATAHGPVRVERLVAGMRLPSEFAGMAAVKWVGQRDIDCRRHPHPADIHPVLVSAHAFGADQPERDLFLSPDHAVFIDGVLIPVRYLLNGRTISQVPREAVSYWHVELERHDVIRAEGLPCESYLDTGNRGAFSNGDGPVLLHPDFALRVWDTAACAPLVLDGAELEAARSWLHLRAELLGHALTDDPDFHLVAGGRILRSQLHGPTYRFNLPVLAGAVQLVSRSAIPAEIRDVSVEHRCLGVAVSRIVYGGQVISLDDPRLTEGWYSPEYGGDATWRWTNGASYLAVSGGQILEIELAYTSRYWMADRPVVAPASAQRHPAA